MGEEVGIQSFKQQKGGTIPEPCPMQDPVVLSVATERFHICTVTYSNHVWPPSTQICLGQPIGGLISSTSFELKEACVARPLLQSWEAPLSSD